MAEPTLPIVKASELFQVGIVVKDLDGSIRQWESILGVGTWSVVEVDSSTTEMTYYGKPVQHSFKAAFTTVGSMMIELIQPLEGEGIYRDFLNEHGEGIHHLGHVRVDNVDEAVKALQNAGFPFMEGGRTPIHRWAYVDTTKALGHILELSDGLDPREMLQLDMSDEVMDPARIQEMLEERDA